MSFAVRAASVATLLIAALVALAGGGSLLLAFALVAVATALAAVGVVGADPAQAALVLAVVAVAGGATAAAVEVVRGIDAQRVEYRGELDSDEILDSFHPGRASGFDGIEAGTHGHLIEAVGEARVPQAGAYLLALWSVGQLAPWALAALALALGAPLLRAARRGAPFREDASGRLRAIGVLLLVGVPVGRLLDYVVADAASGASAMASPLVEPAVSISALHLLPGVLVLALAVVFRRGGELADLERHTV